MGEEEAGMKDEREAYEKNSYHSINVPAVEAVTTTLMSLRYICQAIGPIYMLTTRISPTP